MRTFIVGDIHGALPALKQVLERSKFDMENDRLICLGDVCDGWPYVPECFELLLKIKNMTYIIGNHDWWTFAYFKGTLGTDEYMYWFKQGGQATLDAYIEQRHLIEKHMKVLEEAEHIIEENNIVFVHGGFDPNKSLSKQEPYECMWDRGLLQSARHKHYQKPAYKYGGYDHIFVGHTSTQMFNRHEKDNTKPVHYCNVWDLDTGAGWSGCLTLMELETKEYWQSDNVLELMPGIQGRELRF
jgi:serine/threonine protein phosphatase 1